MISEEAFLQDLQNMLNRDESLSLDMDLLDIDEWDSFSKIAFLAMAKEKYHVELPRFTVAAADTVQDLYDGVLECAEE